MRRPSKTKARGLLLGLYFLARHEHAFAVVEDTAFEHSAGEHSAGELSAGELSAVELSASPTHARCVRHVLYSAPATCPDANTLQTQLGSAYQVHAGKPGSCAQCEISVSVREHAAADAELGRYELKLSGLESSPARRPVCAELVALAVHTVQASALAEPCPTPPEQTSPAFPTELGSFYAPSIHLTSGETYSTLGLQVTWNANQLRASASALWIPPTQLNNAVEGATPDVLSLDGYGMGIDACWVTNSWLQLCSVGMWRRLDVSPSGNHWNNVTPSDFFTMGTGVVVAWQTRSGIGIGIQPTLLFSPKQSATRDLDTGYVLHDPSGFEAQIRLSLTWSLTSQAPPLEVTAKRSQ